MTKRVIRKKRQKSPAKTIKPSLPERAPSITREERPLFSRIVALQGLIFIALGASALAAPLFRRQHAFIGVTTGFFMFTYGIGCVLAHALSERDIQFRRTYGFIGLLLMVFGLLLRIVTTRGEMGSLFMPYGVPALLVGLVLIISYLRFEDDPFWKMLGLGGLGGAGALMIAVGLIYGNANPAFLQGQGVVFCLVGLFYVCAFIAMHESGNDLAHRAAVALGVIGGVTFALALLRSIMDVYYLVPNGFLLMGIGLVYVMVYAGICLDWPIIVLTRRELASLFYSPIAYLVLVGFTLVGWFMFWLFVSIIESVSRAGQAIPEPIVVHFIFSFVTVVGLLILVPILTMRVLSEEKRTGTLEVLLTAPVNETPVVLSKFFAVLSYFLLAWLPWALFLVAMRVVGGAAFDYRPVLSFFIALTVTGAGFLSMGIFCSSITRNQIVAAVFTFVGMMAHVGIYLVHDRFLPQDSAWISIFQYISFLDLWHNSLSGLLVPRFMMFHLTAAVFFLYATTKVLDARKWK